MAGMLIANSFATWPEFPPFIPCSKETLVQLIDESFSQVSKVCFSPTVSQLICSKFGECDLSFLGSGVSPGEQNDCASLFLWYFLLDSHSESMVKAAVSEKCSFTSFMTDFNNFLFIFFLLFNGKDLQCFMQLIGSSICICSECAAPFRCHLVGKCMDIVISVQSYVRSELGFEAIENFFTIPVKYDFFPYTRSIHIIAHVNSDRKFIALACVSIFKRALLPIPFGFEFW